MDNKLDEEILQAVEQLAKTICKSEAFKAYKDAKALAIADYSKMQMIKRAHDLREEIHSLPEHEANSDYAERISSQYEDLMEDTVVYKYTKAELTIGEICRDVFAHILDAMEF